MESDEYRKLAEVEDTLWHFRALHEHIRRCLASHLPGEGGALLDAGCGTGGLLRRLHAWRPGARLTGLDFSPLAVVAARERVPDAAIVEGSIAALPFRDGGFDGIVSADVVCQIDRPEEAFSEFARCLRPGGVAVINVPAFRWMWSYHDETCQTRHRFTRPEIVAHLRAAGLEPVFSTYWNCLAFPLVWARRKLLPPPRGASDVHDYPRFVGWGMGALAAVERVWLAAGGRLPFGTSVLAVGVKGLAAAKPGTV